MNRIILDEIRSLWLWELLILFIGASVRVCLGFRPGISSKALQLHIFPGQKEPDEPEKENSIHSINKWKYK